MIRQFQTEDMQAVIDLANRAWRPIRAMSRALIGDEISDLLNPEGDDVSKGRQVEAFLKAFPGQCLVSVEEGRIAGFVTYQLGSNRIGTIGNNAVDADFRHRGIAQQLYQAVLQRFRNAGMEAACVLTGLDDEHAAARRAYERAGFHPTVQSVTYYRKLD